MSKKTYGGYDLLVDLGACGPALVLFRQSAFMLRSIRANYQWAQKQHPLWSYWFAYTVCEHTQNQFTDYWPELQSMVEGLLRKFAKRHKLPVRRMPVIKKKAKKQ